MKFNLTRKASARRSAREHFASIFENSWESPNELGGAVMFWDLEEAYQWNSRAANLCSLVLCWLALHFKCIEILFSAPHTNTKLFFYLSGHGAERIPGNLGNLCPDPLITGVKGNIFCGFQWASHQHVCECSEWEWEGDYKCKQKLKCSSLFS